MTTLKSKPQTLSKPLPNRKFSLPRTPFSSGGITPITCTLKSVTLSDWWLRKGLRIEGFESKNGSIARRLFSSAPIITRHDSSNLLTVDGISICINGFINRMRSLQNGVSVGVCNRFVLGFPYNWEDYKVDNNNNNDDDDDKELSVLFDDVPMSRLQDLVMMQNKNVFDDVVESLRDFTCVNKTEKSVDDDDGKILVSNGVKTRGMLRQRVENEASTEHHSKTKKKK